MNDEIKEILDKLKNGFCSALTYEKLLDYISNLQEENGRLRTELNGYKSRCKEADEYIKEWQSFPHTNGSTHNELRNLLNILNGGDDK